MWYVYLISNVNDIYYCGITTDIKRRISEHNGLIPGGAKSTRRGRPWTLVTSREVSTMSDALKLEAVVKKTKKENKVKILHQ